MSIKVSDSIKELVLKRDNFKCQKCGYRGLSDDLELHNNFLNKSNDADNLVTLCAICSYFAPDSASEFQEYINEKINWQDIETFRKYKKPVSKKIKQEMAGKADKGNLMTRAPLGYKAENKLLVPAENSAVVDEIFKTFLYKDLSLTQIAKQYNLSVNGLKKILTNYTYLGKIKFAGQILQGRHAPLVSAEIFNKVQDKMKEKGIEKS